MKYMGGKASIAADLVDAMLALSPGRRVFVDAFCGGANVVCRVPSEYLRIANDSNNYLIAMWRGVVGGTEFPERIDKDFYSAQRDLFNKEGFSRSVGDRRRWSDGRALWEASTDVSLTEGTALIAATGATTSERLSQTSALRLRRLPELTSDAAIIASWTCLTAQ